MTSKRHAEEPSWNANLDCMPERGPGICFIAVIKVRCAPRLSQESATDLRPLLAAQTST